MLAQGPHANCNLFRVFLVGISAHFFCERDGFPSAGVSLLVITELSFTNGGGFRVTH